MAVSKACEEEVKIKEEIVAVGAGLGGGFENTKESKVIKFKEAVAIKDKNNWQKAVDEDHERLIQHKVWTPVEK